MTSQIYTRVQAKARARQIRTESAMPMSLSVALERVAREMGFRDWNTASARLSNSSDFSWQVGERVSGRYLKRAFNGRIHAVRELHQQSGYQLTVQFDEPVDVVDWESFSAFRQRVTVIVSPEGITWAKTSDGIPHMIVAPESTLVV